MGEEVTILPTRCKQFISAYCTNAVQGIVPIAKIEDVYFDMKPAFMFSDLMNKQILKKLNLLNKMDKNIFHLILFFRF